MQRKLPSVATNIFSVMSGLAKQHQAINLSQGFPDFPVSENLIDAVAKAMKDGHNQYAPMPGLPELREILAQKINTLYSHQVNAEEHITITPGGTYSIYTSLATILNAGDEVIVLEPAYDSYIPNILVQQAKPVCIALNFPDFSIPWDKIYSAITPSTRAIIINTPHNPTGYVWNNQDMQKLEDMVLKHQLYVISDEVYEHITFDGVKHNSVLNFPKLFERSFVTFSFGKVFHTTGWKMGYCVAPSVLTQEFRKMHQFLAFSCNTPIQVGLAEYLTNPDTYLHLPPFFQAKRDFFLSLLQPLPFTLHQPAAGSYFQLVGYENISDLPDKEFAIWMTQEIGVAVIPVSAFYHNGKDDKLVRFCFAKKDETLQAAAQKLQKLVTK